MLVINIQIWPKGDETKAKTIAMAKITNDGTGTKAMGNYTYQLWTEHRPLKHGKGRIHGFLRNRKNVWHLLFLILKECLEQDLSLRGDPRFDKMD